MGICLKVFPSITVMFLPVLEIVCGVSVAVTVTASSVLSICENPD